MSRTAAAIILSVVYGIKVDESVDEQGDNYVSLANKAMESLSRAGIFGTYMVVIIVLAPPPRVIPLTHF
jgi:hypothetical protein